MRGPGSLVERPWIAHHLTVDIEEYFQIAAFGSLVLRDGWEGFASRVGRGVAAETVVMRKGAEARQC